MFTGTNSAASGLHTFDTKGKKSILDFLKLRKKLVLLQKLQGKNYSLIIEYKKETQ